MKNLVTFVTSSTHSHRKFSLTEKGSKKHIPSISYSYSSDPFIDDLSISLQSFCFGDYSEFKPGAKKIVHDCNSNNVSVAEKNHHPKLRRLRSWNKGFSRKFRGGYEAEQSDSVFEDNDKHLEAEVSSKPSKHKRAKSTSDWQINEHRKETFSTATVIKTDSYNSTTKRQRKFSTPSLSRKSSDYTINHPSTNPPVQKQDFVDFGACYSPEEMKTWGQVIDKLATTIKNTNNTAHRRYSSISDTLNQSLKEPAKKYISSHSLKRRRKTYDGVRRNKSSDDLDSVDCGESDTSKVENDSNEDSINVHDCSLNRETIDDSLGDLNDISFSANIWYYGELHTDFDLKREPVIEEGNGLPECDKAVTGTVLARVDTYGDVVYSLTYNVNGELITGKFPCENDRYCLDFSDPEQPRFPSVKFLIAYLIEQRLMQRVTFSWLLDHCVDV